MNSKIFFLFIFFLIVFTSCEDVVELELPDGEAQLVVDGWLTDQVGEKKVRLSTTTNYFNNSGNTFVAGAEVILYVENEPKDTLIEKTNGVYTTDYVGQIGLSYHLYIRTATGEVYESVPEMLHAVPVISAIYSTFKEESTFEDEGYYISIDTNEPLGLGNHYWWKQYVNGEYQNEPFDLLFESDEFVDGNPILNFEVTINNPLELGDTYLIQQLSISEGAFDFLTALQTQTASVGSLFDSPPAALPGNIINQDPNGKKALGYFGVSSVSEKRTIIE
jgi:hypothetical protein